MFGIGFQEMLVIFVVALLVVGPDKLPELARSLAKGLFELKKNLNEVKGAFAEEEKAVDGVSRELRETAEELRKKVMLDIPEIDELKRAAGEVRAEVAGLADAARIDASEEPEAAADREASARSEAESQTAPAASGEIIDVEAAEVAESAPSKSPDASGKSPKPLP